MMLLFSLCLAVAAPAAPVQPEFRADNGIWTLDGQPFFGTTAHAIFHTFKRDRDAGLADLEALKAAGFNMVEVYWIWARDQHEDGAFDFTAFDDFVEASQQLGLRNFCAIIHPAPEWLRAQHGWYHLDEDGEGKTTDGFYVCDAAYREESDRFVQALINHLADSPEISENILYYALGGEYYPFQPDRENDTGYEAATVAAFRDALKLEFSLNELGERWNSDPAAYESWDDVWPAVRTRATDFSGAALANYGAAVWDWYDFRAQAVAAFFQDTGGLFRDAGDERIVTHEYNVRAPGQRRTMRWEAMTGDGSGFNLATMDFTAEYDYSDMLWWVALARGGSHPPQQNNEFTGYASHHWLTRHAWALQGLGATGLNVWDWRSAEWGLNLPDGTPRESLAAAEHFNAQARGLGESLSASRPLTEEISILMLDEEDLWRPHAHQTEIKQLLQAFLVRGLGGQVNIITNPSLFDSRSADAKLLIVPHIRHVRRSIAVRLADFVERGGVLWLMPGSFQTDETDAPHDAVPAPPLNDVAGITAKELSEPLIGVATSSTFALADRPAAVLVEDLAVRDADVIATLDGQPAVTARRHGAGWCVYQAAEFADISPMLEGWEGRATDAVRSVAAQRQLAPGSFLAYLLELADIQPPAVIRERGQVATDVLVSARELPEGRLLVLIDLYNHPHDARVELTDVPSGWSAVRAVPELADPVKLKRGSFRASLQPAEVQVWLAGRTATVATWHADLRGQMPVPADTPPPGAPYPLQGEVTSVPTDSALEPINLGDGYHALDLSMHANRSLVEDPKVSGLAQFVTQAFDVDVRGGSLELTFQADNANAAGPFWVVNGLEITAPGDTPIRRFDFGDEPVADGFERVAADMTYSPEHGFGWLDLTGLDSRDRETSNADALRRDFTLDRASNAPHAFGIDIPDGAYRVAVTMGDAHFHFGPMSVLADGEMKLSAIQTGSSSIAVEVADTGAKRKFFGSAGNDLRELPVGDVTFAGIPYHIPDPAVHLTSCLVFASRTREVSRLVKAEGIRVDLDDVRALHFLQAAGWNAPTGTPIGRYIAHYADGTAAVQQFVAGINIGSWWGDGEEHGASCDVAWIGNNPGTRRWDINCLLYHHRWDNPHPAKRLASLDVEGYWMACNPFIVAITAESGAR